MSNLDTVPRQQTSREYRFPNRCVGYCGYCGCHQTLQLFSPALETVTVTHGACKPSWQNAKQEWLGRIINHRLVFVVWLLWKSTYRQIGYIYIYNQFRLLKPWHISDLKNSLFIGTSWGVAPRFPRRDPPAATTAAQRRPSNSKDQTDGNKGEYTNATSVMWYDSVLFILKARHNCSRFSLVNLGSLPLRKWHSNDARKSRFVALGTWNFPAFRWSSAAFALRYERSPLLSAAVESPCQLTFHHEHVMT